MRRAQKIRVAAGMCLRLQPYAISQAARKHLTASVRCWESESGKTYRWLPREPEFATERNTGLRPVYGLGGPGRRVKPQRRR